MKKLLVLASVCACVFASDGASIYKQCQACHGLKAEKKYLGKVPALASLEASYMIKALQGYKNGSNNKYKTGMIMKAQASRLSEADMKNVAKYISSFAKK